MEGGGGGGGALDGSCTCTNKHKRCNNIMEEF